MGVLESAIAALVTIVLLLASAFSRRRIVPYYIENRYNFDKNLYESFARETERILATSQWNERFAPIRVGDPALALIKISLTPNSVIEMLGLAPQYYDDGRRIKFSVTTQSTFMRPYIYINADNWVEGVVESGLSLADYRRYVINHEFGHGLGFNHAKCTTNPCPVMYQSTRGCPATCGMEARDEDYEKKIKGRFIYF